MKRMNDAESWLYFDGPEPAHLKPLLDALRELPPATPGNKERAIRRFLERLDATSSRGQAPAGGEEAEGKGSGPAGAPDAPDAPVAPVAAPSAERRGNKDDVTARSLTFEDRSDVLLPGNTSDKAKRR